jgi:DNA-binding NarL/FixJ family response regulator
MTDEAGAGGAGARESEPITVLVVDDHPTTRHGVRSDLEGSNFAKVVAEAGDGGEAIELALDLMPDVILMDLYLPTVSGVEAIRRIREHNPTAKILVLSVDPEEDVMVEAIKAGASGYLVKSASAEELVEAVRRVQAGELALTPWLAARVLNQFRKGGTGDPLEPKLTPRENEVLKLIAKGYKYREIAQKLFIATKTVQNHTQNILSKLEIHSRYELMRYAILHGLDRSPD